MKVVRFLIFVFVFIMFFSCSNSYDSVIDSFNKGHFHEEPTAAEPYSIKSKNFYPSEMLSDSYDLRKGMILILSAPQGGVFYKWTAVVKDEEKKKLENKTDIGSEIDLEYVLPGIFRDEVVNKLVLTVTDEDGNEYQDTAFIIIE